VWGGIAGIAAASGPLLGGVLTASVSWRAVFMVNLPVGALALWLVWRHVEATSWSEGAGRLDPLGQLMAVACLSGLVVALIHGGNAGWRQPLVLGGLVASAACAPATRWCRRGCCGGGRSRVRSPSACC
jgi:MFS transporter, DHA2 family, methylenomycin A resistance protein